MDASSIIEQLQQLQQYEIYEPIVRRLGGEILNFNLDDVSILTSGYPVAAVALYIWDFGAQRSRDVH
jgi:hypothetical protein